jgi:hypothetical protein
MRTLAGAFLVGPGPKRSTAGAPANTWVSRSDSTIFWSARSRPAKLSRKQAQRHSTDEGAEGANQQPVAPEPVAALIVREGDTCFQRQD